MKTAASSGSSSPSSISIFAREGVDHRVPCGVAVPDGARPASGAPRQVALADVEQDQDRLLGQEPEAAERLLLVRVEGLVADRAAGLQGGLEPREDRLLALVGLALRRRAVAARALAAAPGAGRPSTRSARMNSRSSCSRSRARVDGAGRVRVVRRRSQARTTWISASESRSRARCSAGSSSVPTWPSDDAGGAGRST